MNVFCVFHSNRWFQMILDGKPCKIIQSLPEFKASFLALHFSYYTFIIFLTMLSVVFLCRLMMLFFILNDMRHLIFGKNWLLNLNLTYKKMQTGAGSGLLITMLEKRNFSCLMGLLFLVLLM